MNKESNPPVCYQLSISNVISIGNKTMTQFYISFQSQTNSNIWKSPVVYGKIDKHNSEFPWSFIADTPKLVVNVHMLNEGDQSDLIVGSTPLFLLKKQGEQEFLVFGSTQQNRGRKVAEIDFQYCQCSLIKMEQDLQVESNSKHSKTQKPEEKLVIIPQQSLRENEIQQSRENRSTRNEGINPSKLDTLSLQNVFQEGQIPDSNLSIIKEIQDVGDRWYRLNFGRGKPINLQLKDFQYENTELVQVRYEKGFSHLEANEIQGSHFQLKRFGISCQNKIKAMEIFAIEANSEGIQEKKVATVQAYEGFLSESKARIQLPEGVAAFAVQLATDSNKKLKGLMRYSQDTSADRMQIFDPNGDLAGCVSYSLKWIKNIQIQTLELMNENPKEQAISENEAGVSQTQILSSKSVALENMRRYREGTSTPFKNRIGLERELLNQVYFQSQKYPKERATQPLQVKQEQKQLLTSKHSDKGDKGQNMMNNKAYLSAKKAQFRKNRFEVPKQYEEPLRQNNSEVEPEEPEKQVQTSKPRLYKNSTQAKRQKEQNYSQQSQQQQESDKNNAETRRKAIVSDPHRRELKQFNQLPAIPDKSDESKVNSEVIAIPVVLSYNRSQRKDRNQKEPMKLSEHIEESRQGRSFKSIDNQPTQISPAQRSQMQKIRKISFPRQRLTNPQNDSKINLNNKQTNQDRETEQNRRSYNDLMPEEKPLKYPHKKKTYEANLEQTAEKQGLKLKQSSLPQAEHDSKAEKETVRLAALQNEKDLSEFGVNTDRMAICNNVFQSSFAPPADKPLKESKKEGSLQKQQIIQKESLKQEQDIAPFSINSLSNEFLNVRTKYSMKTIQPPPQEQRISFMLLTVSVNYDQNCMGQSFLRIFIRNKNTYETDRIKHSNSLTWKCTGFIFQQALEQENLQIELLHVGRSGITLIGKAIFSIYAFRGTKQQKLLKADLIDSQYKVGDVVLSFQPIVKSTQLTQHSQSHRKKNLTVHSKEKSITDFDEDSPIRSLQKKKKKKKKNERPESLTDFLKRHRKQKINRYIINEYSRAGIESRVNPIRQKKYGGGKNITIGRDVRFPYSLEDEHFRNVPGPGAYEQNSQFKKYRNQTQYL